MTKTQPLMTIPQARIQSAPVTVAPPAEPAAARISIDTMVRPIYWALFGISTVILLIQIWTYLILNYG